MTLYSIRVKLLENRFLVSAAILAWLTASHPNSEVKQVRAGVVLRWGTTREGPVLLFLRASPLLSRRLAVFVPSARRANEGSVRGGEERSRARAVRAQSDWSTSGYVKNVAPRFSDGKSAWRGARARGHAAPDRSRQARQRETGRAEVSARERAAIGTG